MQNTSSLIFPSVDDILDLHDSIIENTGGAHGILDINALESAIKRPQTGYYTTVVEHAAALLESLIMNHPFLDGNKRTGFCATDTFLRHNGFYIDCDSEEADMYIVNSVAQQTLTKDSIIEWLSTRIRIYNPPHN